MRRNAFGQYAQKAKFPGDLLLSHETKNLLSKKVAANGKTGEIVRVYPRAAPPGLDGSTRI
jgi:hypothetical protein